MPLYSFFLFIFMTFYAITAQSQNLFGNPTCSEWQVLSARDKLTWLNAYLVPLNLTNVSRKKPKTDKFSQLASLDTASSHVDRYCNSHNEAYAAVGAIQFLDELTSTE